jgi:cysteine desulfurase
MNVYFDNAATTAIRKEVIDKMTLIMNEIYGNPSSTHSFGRKAKAYLENARKSIASILNAEPQEIIFTSGGTESDNMIIQRAVLDLNIKTIISSPIEHHAVIHAIENLDNISYNNVSLTKDGSVDLEHLKKLLTENDQLKLVSLMYVNNEIGNILDLKKVGELCKKHNAYFHTDAVQGIGHFEIDLTKLSIDFLSAAAHKFHGPKGVGFSFIRKSSGLNGFIHGGEQERGLRAGTEAIHNIVGMQLAMELSYKNLKKERAKILDLKKYFLNKLKEVFPDMITNGLSGSYELSTYTLINVTFPLDEDKSKLIEFQLDLNGIACSKGSACQSGSSLGSHVLNYIHSDSLKEKPSIRFSFCRDNTKKEVDYVIDVLKKFKG